MKDKFKNKLEELNVDWNKDKGWEKLEPKLPKKRNYFLLFFILGVILFGGIYFGYDHLKKPIPSKHQTAIHDTASNNTTFGSSTEQHSLEQSIADSSQELNTLRKTTKATKPTTITPIISEPSTDASTRIETANNSLNTKTGSTNTITTNKAKTKITLIEKQLSPKQQDQSSDQFKVSNKNENQSTYQTQSKKTKINSVFENHDQQTSFKSILPLLLLNAKQISILEIDLTTKPFKPQYQEIKSKDQAELPKFHIDLIVSAGLPFRKITGNGHIQLDSSARAFYKKFELPKLYTGIGANLGYNLTPNLSVLTGLNFETFHETLDWSGNIGQETEVVQYEKAYYVLETNGDSSFYAGSAKVINNSTRHVVHRNKLSYFSIPLTLSISKAFHPVSISLSAGLHWGFASKFSGKYIDVENIFPTVRENEPIKFSNRFGWHTKLTSSLRLGKLSRLNISLAFKNHSTIELDEIELKYHTLALNIGYRRLFGG